MKNKEMDMAEFIPENVLISNSDKTVKLLKNAEEIYIDLSYITQHYNGSWREHSLSIPRFVLENELTFEVIGLLQAEMGKTNNGNLSFSNHEYKIINCVMNWFEKEMGLDKDVWRWSIKLNIQEPTDPVYRVEIEKKVIKHWLNRTQINLDSSYPKKVTYIKNTKNTLLKFYDEGTLVLEYKNNLFSQIIKNFVKKVTYEKILNYDINLIAAYIRGIIAGEGTIECNNYDKKYRVHISVTKEKEKEIYFRALQKMGIASIKYKGDKLVISKRKNNIELLKQRLTTLSPEKYNKFLNMMKKYPGIEEETSYFKPKGINVWNKIPEEKVKSIVDLYNSGLTRTFDIAEKAGVSSIKVNRVLKDNNLGKRVVKLPEEKRKEIALFFMQNIKLTQKQIAEQFKIHESTVRRALMKYRN